MATAPATKAFAYLRVSSAGQVDGHGFERQEAAVRAFAAEHGFAVVDTFRDAHTGTEADRPAFSAMVGTIRANGVRHIIVERLDRFARDIGVQVALLGMLQRDGITLIEATTGRDVTAALADDPMAKGMVSIQGVFHQIEKELLVRKLKQARDAVRAKTGRCGGRYPYGEDPSRPDEARVLATVRRLHRRSPKTGERRSAAEIADELQRAGIPTRSGKPWSRHSVREILKRLNAR